MPTIFPLKIRLNGRIIFLLWEKKIYLMYSILKKTTIREKWFFILSQKNTLTKNI